MESQDQTVSVHREPMDDINQIQTLQDSLVHSEQTEQAMLNNSSILEIQHNSKKKTKDENILESPDVKANENDKPSPSFNENFKKSTMMDQIEEQTFAENKSEKQSIGEEQDLIKPTVVDEEEQKVKNTEEIAKREGEILETLDNSKEIYRKIFIRLADSEEKVYKDKFQSLIEEVCELVGQTVGSTNILSLQSTLRIALDELHKLKVHELGQESKEKEAEIHDQKVGLTFNEFYHELFMGIVRNSQDERIQESLIKGDENEIISMVSPSNQTLSQIKNDLKLPNAGFEHYPSAQNVGLNKSVDISMANDKSRSSKPKTSTPGMDKIKLEKLLAIMDSVADQITDVFNNPKFSLKIQIQEVFNVLPVKVVKKIQDDDLVSNSQVLSHQKTGKSHDYRTLETFETEVSNLMRHLVDNDGRKANIELFKECLEAVFNGKSGIVKIEIIEKNQEDDKNKQEAQSLDDFLLMNQSSMKSVTAQSPSITDSLKGTIKTYQDLLDRRKFKNEVERKKLIDLIRSLQQQLALMQSTEKKDQNSILEPFDAFQQQNTLQLTPITEKGQEQFPLLTKYEKREKMLKNIFDFYCKQQMLLGRKATFEEIQKDLSHINMAEFMRFCIDFKVPLSKSKIVEVFKKNAGNLKEIEYYQFNDTIVKLFTEANKEQIRMIQKKANEHSAKLNQSQFAKEAQNQLVKLKGKTQDDIQEEAYLFLELDHPHRIEQKKKGLNLPFHTHAKDYGFQSGTGVTATSQSKHRMINLSEEEKRALKERVQKIKLQRELQKTNMKDVKNLRYTQLRQQLLQNMGTGRKENDNISDNTSQKPTSAISQNMRKQATSLQSRGQRKDSHQVLTLAQLATLSYTELNSNSVDDFNPQQLLGIEESQSPEQIGAPLNENVPYNSQEMKIYEGIEVSQGLPQVQQQINTQVPPQPPGSYQSPQQYMPIQQNQVMQVQYIQQSPPKQQIYSQYNSREYPSYQDYSPQQPMPIISQESQRYNQHYSGQMPPILQGRQPLQQKQVGQRSISQSRGTAVTQKNMGSSPFYSQDNYGQSLSNQHLNAPQQVYQSQSQYNTNQQQPNQPLLQKQFQVRSTSGNNFRNSNRQQAQSHQIHHNSSIQQQQISQNPYRQIKLDNQQNQMNYYHKSRAPMQGHMLPPLPLSSTKKDSNKNIGQ